MHLFLTVLFYVHAHLVTLEVHAKSMHANQARVKIAVFVHLFRMVHLHVHARLAGCPKS